jgi:hypothetical protein
MRFLKTTSPTFEVVHNTMKSQCLATSVITESGVLCEFLGCPSAILFSSCVLPNDIMHGAPDVAGTLANDAPWGHVSDRAAVPNVGSSIEWKT